VTENVVEVHALSKRFSRATSYRALLRPFRGPEILAVDQVDLSVREGELFGLLGPNGAGKTTLVKMLCTLILPSAGEARVHGWDVVSEAEAVKRIVGLVDCQERSFFWRLSGWQNLKFFAALYGLYGARAEARIRDLLDLVGLSDQADRRFMTYSTGMRQRLAVARGLIAGPRVVFMDEPTRSLDPVVARDLRAFIRNVLVDELGRTVVLVTHRLEEAEELCDRVAIMNKGRIIACGPVDEIKRRIPARCKYALRARGIPPQAADEIARLPGVLSVVRMSDEPGVFEAELILSDEREVLPGLLRHVVQAGGEVERCRSQGLSLEEAFVHLVKDDGDGT